MFEKLLLVHMLGNLMEMKNVNTWALLRAQWKAVLLVAEKALLLVEKKDYSQAALMVG